jgi:Domain of unknown function (DUF4383)
VDNRSAVQTAAQVVGVIYVAVGILGFLPIAHANGALFGVLEVNALDDIGNIVIGVAGLAAAASVANARAFCQAVGAALLIVGVLGIFVTVPLGLLHLGGAAIALHLLSGAILAYFGFLAPTVR